MIKLFRDEVLNSIDAIESNSIYTESCVLNEVFNINSKFDEIESITQESMFDSDSIIGKVIAAIKRFFHAIRLWADRVISKMTNMIRHKHNNVDGIMIKTLEESEMNTAENPDSWDIPKAKRSTVIEEYYIDDNDEVITESFKAALFKNKGDNDTVRVKIPAGKESIIASALVDVPMGDIVCAFDDDTKSIKFKIFGEGKFSTVTSTNGNNTDPMNIPKTKNPWSGSAKTALYLIKNPDEFERITQLVDLALAVINKNDKNAEKMLNKNCSHVIDSIYHKADKLNVEKCVISMKDLTSFQKNLNAQNIRMDKYVNIEKTDVSEMDKHTIKTMNELTNKLIRIQISMNMLSSALDNKSIINGNFVGSIKSVALLDIFVKRCIDAGIPPKYIGYNAWLISDESIRGKNETFKPIWGQTRVIFFPPSKKIVYKVALSGAGISSNEAEVRTSKLFVEMDRVDLIAPVVKAWGNGAVVALERIPSSKNKPSYDALLKYTKDVNSVIRKYEEKNNVKINTKISDQHRDNVMYDERLGCYRSIDYGIAKRTS